MEGRRVYEYDVLCPSNFLCLIGELASDGVNLLRGDSKAFSNVETKSLCYRVYELRAY